MAPCNLLQNEKNAFWAPAQWRLKEIADVPVAQQQRLCLFSGESVTDSPAVNSSATVKAKTNSFIVLFSAAPYER